MLHTELRIILWVALLLVNFLRQVQNQSGSVLVLDSQNATSKE
jgi:hypothetical protein